jgi:hypothetical protein
MHLMKIQEPSTMKTFIINMLKNNKNAIQHAMKANENRLKRKSVWIVLSRIKKQYPILLQTQRTTDTSALRALFQSELRIRTKDEILALLVPLSTLIDLLYTYPNSEDKYRAQLRTDILRQHDEAFVDLIKSQHIFAMSALKKAQCIRLSNTRIENGMKHPLILTKKWIECTLYPHLSSNITLADMIILVILATGSRFIEVVKTSTYSIPALSSQGSTSSRGSTIFEKQRTRASSRLPTIAIPCGNSRNIIITGLAKQVRPSRQATFAKHRKLDHYPTITTITKPTLFIEPQQVIKLVDEIRMTLSNTRPSISHLVLNRRCNNILTQIHKDISTCTLRKIYAAYSYEVYGKSQDMQPLAWIAQVLGHQSSTTSRSYHSILIK